MTVGEDIGHGVTVRLVGVNPDAVNAAGERIYPDDVPGHVGAIVAHHKPDGTPCEGIVHWWRRPGEAGETWTLHSLDPLHLEPSIQCACGFHGYIRGGRWEPC